MRRIAERIGRAPGVTPMPMPAPGPSTPVTQAIDSRSLGQQIDDYRKSGTPRAQATDAMLNDLTGVGSMLAGVAVPAAVAIPTLMSAGQAGDEYGTGAVNLGTGVAGGMLGAHYGNLAAQMVGIPGTRRAITAVAALLGAGAGGMAAGPINRSAQGMVNDYATGGTGFGATLGQAASGLGYTSAISQQERKLREMKMSPAYQEVERVREKQKLDNKVAMMEQLYLQSLVS